MMPDTKEFTLFHECLMRSAPDGYEPFYFKGTRHDKHPQYGVSLKLEINRLTFEQAVEWMKQGGNVCLAGKDYDALVNVDLDGDKVDKNVLKPTLTTRSRSRTGIHGFYFTSEKENIPNIATDNDGEVRCNNQYVVVAGSFVPVDDVEKIPVEHRDRAGYYTVEDAQPPGWITFNDLPQFFKDYYLEAQEKSKNAPKPSTFNPKKASGKHSAVFDVTARDVMIKESGSHPVGSRWPAIASMHNSESRTGSNMSLSDSGLLQCWRHAVSLNGLQSLFVLSGYLTCGEAGSPHRNSGAPPAMGTGDNEAIFRAWLYAKENGYIPQDDPIPVTALHHIAKKHHGYEAKKGELLPRQIYLLSLKTVREEY